MKTRLNGRLKKKGKTTPLIGDDVTPTSKNGSIKFKH